MRLGALLEAIPDARVVGSRDVEIGHLSSDSRQVRPGSLFIALRGQHANGHVFVQNAVAQGAVAAVVEESAALPAVKASIPLVYVNDSRTAMARLAQKFYGHPSSRLRLIGVTGTNGKTTTTYLIKSILRAAGHRAGLLGTVAYELDGETVEATHTTPESVVLQGLLARLVEKGVGYAVMEVSSHALVLNRVEGCEFDIAVFTNLTQDHLDFHRTMESYFESKRELFAITARSPEKAWPKRAVINRDDPWGRRLLEGMDLPVWTYGLEGAADFTLSDLHCTLEALTFTAVTPAGSFPVRSGLVGRYNAYNILAAIGAAVHLGIAPEQIRQGIASLGGVPGRFERLDCGLGFNVIVDFAHTEAALARLLQAVAELSSGRIITVFGCGGDR
ncbi:MAG TPA: UDP-N-acetylmuramoyl-L-alanyl-D-glutamate--2,6-diaminopimelate ligase, partial [Nitrospiria bacterium]